MIYNSVYVYMHMYMYTYMYDTLSHEYYAILCKFTWNNASWHASDRRNDLVAGPIMGGPHIKKLAATWAKMATENSRN